MADIKDLIGAIVNKDALLVKGIFEELIAEKIGERMDFLRPLVAESMFDEGKMKCEECGYGMAKEDSNCKKCGCSMNEDYDWDSFIDEEINESDDNVKDDAPDTVAKNHPIMQLKKLVDTKGGSFTTAGGKTLNMTHRDAARLLSLHTAAQSSETKQKLATAIHKDPIGTHDRFFPNVKINEADQAMIGGPIKVMPKHNSDHIFTYHGPGGYYGGSRTYVYANPKGDKHERFQVVHQGPDQGGEHGTPRMKVSYHPDALSAQKHAEKLAGKGAERVREEVEINELDRVLGSYATKALNRGDIAVRMSNSPNDGMGKIANKRFTGVTRAAERMAKLAGDKATGTRIATNVKNAAAAGLGASSGSNKGTEDGGKAYYAAQRGINKLRDKLNIEEKSELDEGNPENKLKKRAVTRAIGGRAIGPTGMQNILRPYNRNPARGAVVANQAALKAGRDTLRGGTNEETELDERNQANKVKKIGYEIRRGHEMVKKGEDSIPTTGRDGRQLKRISRANPNEETELDEAGMPSGVASHKTMLRNMSDADFAASPHYGKMTDDTLRSMAWGHGYGKPGTPGHNHYVNKKKDGLKALAAAEKKD
jgi:hypothetical protein